MTIETAEPFADPLDRAAAQAEQALEAALEEQRRACAKMPAGEPGECQFCEGYFIRVVNKACGRCRDKYKLP
jgi:hypothetical protein